ncbi:MAG TPA: patatin-like phospholipase family protein [Candidatus Limnocylindrales bacterium]
MAMRRILAIDGGGVRGIIPAVLLARLEAVTGRPARETFDFVAGTSTGAVIAGALATGIPADRLVSLYRRRGPELFRSLFLVSGLQRLVAGRLYDTKALHRILLEELGEHAGIWLNDLPLDVLFTAVRLSDGHPWYFVKDRPGINSARTGALRLADCVTASASAPTYFAPWLVPGVGTLVDGGAGVAGNPVYQACVEAFEYTEPGAYDPAATVVVSLGPGATSIGVARHGSDRGCGGSSASCSARPASSKRRSCSAITRRRRSTGSTSGCRATTRSTRPGRGSTSWRRSGGASRRRWTGRRSSPGRSSPSGSSPTASGRRRTAARCSEAAGKGRRGPGSATAARSESGWTSGHRPDRRCLARRDLREPLEVDHPEEQQQDDDQPRHAEDPEKQRNHLAWEPPSALNVRGEDSHAA